MKTGSTAVAQATDRQSEEQASAKPSALLVGIAAIIHQTAADFETTIGAVTEALVGGAALGDRQLVVKMQSFDRFRQELTALADVLDQFAAVVGHARDGEAPFLVDTIAISDLKNRLLELIERPVAQAGPPDEEVFF